MTTTSHATGQIPPREPVAATTPVTGTGALVRLCPCGQSERVRLYPCGWRCARHTPAALAGEPEPDQIAAVRRAALVSVADTLGAAPIHSYPPGQGGPCARCGARHHRYGPGGQPLCPACRGATPGRGDAVSGHALDTGGA